MLFKRWDISIQSILVLKDIDLYILTQEGLSGDVSWCYQTPYRFAVTNQQMFVGTMPKPAYNRQGLDWIIGSGNSFVVFSTHKTMETNQKP